MLHRSLRYLRAAGALTLVSGSLFVSGAPIVAAAGIAIQPMLITRFASATQAPDSDQCVQQFTEPCYQPAQMQAAYDEQPLFNRGITGRGQTIVIVDSFGSPTIRSDLATFDREFGLPAPPSFRVIQPVGRVPRYNGNDGTQRLWAGETTLDVDWAHTMAPRANILLVETPVPETTGLAGMPQIVEAENYVIDHHLGQVISQSFGAAEATFPSASSIYGLRSAYVNAEQNNVTVLAAAGDQGATDDSNAGGGTLLYTHRAVLWPATDPLVTAVGGLSWRSTTTGSGPRRTRCGTTATTPPCLTPSSAAPTRPASPPAAASRRPSGGRRTRTACPTWSAITGASPTSP